MPFMNLITVGAFLLVLIILCTCRQKQKISQADPQKFESTSDQRRPPWYENQSGLTMEKLLTEHGCVQCIRAGLIELCADLDGKELQLGVIKNSIRLLDNSSSLSNRQIVYQRLLKLGHLQKTTFCTHKNAEARHLLLPHRMNSSEPFSQSSHSDWENEETTIIIP